MCDVAGVFLLRPGRGGSGLDRDGGGSAASRHRYLHSSFLGLCTYPLLRSRPLRVPPLRRLTLEERQSKQSALAPPLGASPRLGMPAVRHCSVGPPRSAIHGRVAATPASMPGCPLRNICLRPAWFNGAPEIKIKSQIKSRATATAKPGREAAFPPVGAGLPAMAVYQSINVLADAPSSQASQLPQGYAHASTIRSAVRPPRFAFDLRRPVKPRWPSSDIDLGGKPAGRRFSRAGPWMAHRGGPPNQCRMTGTPSLGEVPSGGARALLVTFGALFQK
ncbi:MAG: hypothetical protein ACFWTR_02420 [Pseudomonas shahriarae]|jgi:hypothetical protein